MPSPWASGGFVSPRGNFLDHKKCIVPTCLWVHKTNEEMRITTKLARLVISKQGLRIEEIQRSCHVEIVTPPKGENYFTIFGKRDNIRQAKEAINKITQQYITREMGKEKNENEKNQREEKYKNRPETETESDKYQARDIRFLAEVPTKIQLTTYESG